MRFNNVSIKGIFIYTIGVDYEIGDIILHDSVLYYVQSPYTTNEPPNRSTHCIPYIEYLSNLSDADNKIITGKNFQSILNGVIGGLSLDGRVTSINLNNVDLDTLKSPCIYHIIKGNTIIDNLASIVLSESALLRVYLTNEGVTQEIVDYNTPMLLFRVFKDNNWEGWKMLINGSQSDSDKFNETLDTINTELYGMMNKLRLINDDKRIVFREALLSETEYPSSSVKVEVAEDSLLSVGISYEIDSNEYQEFIYVDTGLSSSTIAMSSNGYKITADRLSTSGGRSLFRLNVEFGPRGMKIFKVLESSKL